MVARHGKSALKRDNDIEAVNDNITANQRNARFVGRAVGGGITRLIVVFLNIVHCRSSNYELVICFHAAVVGALPVKPATYQTPLVVSK